MSRVDIMDGVQEGICAILFKAWRHSGHIDLFTSDSVEFTVDGEKYILRLESGNRGG